MALLERSIDTQVEECILFKVYIPPLEYNGRKYKLTDAQGNIQGSLPPINFLIPDGEGGLIKARFHSEHMRWEVEEN